MYSEEEDFDCPLCMEELDISDRNFRPCPCGYQICRFCWHHIKEDLNGRCPACRRIYSEETVEFTPISADELAMIKNEKKAKEREKKEIEAMNRKHLANMRVVQKSLVYVIGLPPKLANDEHTLRQHEYFGQYGKISKVVINRRNAPVPSSGASAGVPSIGVYITYARKEDAAKAIAAIDGSIWDGKILRASYGTTKYCTYYLRGMTCQNPNCMYLHEPGEDADSYTKEDLAVGKHHLQEHIVPYDPSIHKPVALGRPTLPSHASSSSSTPRPRPTTVSSYHTNPSSITDWPAPGEKPPGDDREKDKDRDEESSALPVTASWAKIGSNPSTPILMNSKPLSRRTTTEPPPLHAKGSSSSIITGVIVNNGKQKENTHTAGSPILDYEPTPAEALALEAAAKEKMLQEQRQLQEQQRKLSKKQAKDQDDAEQQVETLNRKLRKQRQQELERFQQEMGQKLQAQKDKEEAQKQHQEEVERSQQEMEQKLQAQKDKEDQRKEQKECEAREKKELELREAEEKARKEREELEQKKKEEAERKERKRLEFEEQKRKQMDNMFVTTPTLSLGSFSFNPDASLATQPLAFGNGSSLMSLGSETPGAFGLDSFSAFSNLPVTPGHYTGSFNPFSMDDEPLMRRSVVPPARSFLDDLDYDPMTGRSRPVGPPIPGKPRQTSRFGFAMDQQYGDSFGHEGYSSPQAMQDGFRALFPNVNVSFGDSMNVQQQQQQSQQQQQQQRQQQQQQLQQLQQQQFPTSPLFHRQEAPQNAGWDSSDKQDTRMLQRGMNQLSMDPMLTTPSSRMAEYHQQLQMQQQYAQRSGPPGITRSALASPIVKSPPPGLESVARADMSNWASQQQSPLQQRQQHSSRMNSWSSDSTSHISNSGLGANQEPTQDVFGASLKTGTASPLTKNRGSLNSMAFPDPAIMFARISSAGPAKASLVEALQTPPGSFRMTASQDGLRSLNNEGMSDRVSDNDKMSETQTILQKQLPTRQSTPDSPSSLQNIPPGSKRKEIKSVKGVLNSGMNAPLNGGSRSRPPSTPGSPLVEYRMQLFGQQQQQQQQQQTAPGESSLVNGLSSAAARSAKVKSDLLMGLNSPNIRPDRFSTTTMKDTSESTQQQGIKMANGHGGFYASSSPYISNSYSNNANGYGSNPTTGAASGPPPGFGNSASGSGNNSPYLMSTLLGRVQENNSNKPLDVASMMSALDFFGPGQASSLMMSPNWNLANGTNMNDNNFGGNGSSGQSHLINGGALSVGSDESNGNTIVNTNNNNSNNHAKNANDDNSDNTNNDTITSASAHSVEDLELQVINAKMETQMLENQLNAVIKRNRRKLYA